MVTSMNGRSSSGTPGLTSVRMIFYQLTLLTMSSGISISQVYCNRETQQAFCMIWHGWMDAIRTITGKPLLIKALHGEGQHVTFLMDRCAVQVQGLGDHLLTLNDPAKSGISTSDPDELVQYMIRMCDVHCNRYAHNLLFFLIFGIHTMCIEILMP